MSTFRKPLFPKSATSKTSRPSVASTAPTSRAGSASTKNTRPSPPPQFAVVVSHFNEDVTGGLLRGAKAYLEEKSVILAEEDIFRAPGSFEIPLIAQTLAQTVRYDGVICLGCVIKGDTAHFEFISLGATIGIMESMLVTEVPITFGILTTYTDEQAIVRSRDDAHNKGREAAAACLETAELLQKIRSTKITRSHK
jgi:6,7-dimethyl-8-ribityllumazine synthase